MSKAQSAARVVARNVKAIAALQVESTRVHWRVKGEKGLVLTVHPDDERAWGYRGQIGTGAHRQQLFKVLGDYRTMTLEKAIEAADAMRTKVAEGFNPSAPAAETLDDLFKLWLEQHAKPKLATCEMEESRYERHMKKPLGARRFADIERKDVREVRDIVSEASGPIESNRVVALFNRIANWAVEEDHAKFNPAAKLKKTGTEKRRERVMDNVELRRVWEALSEPVVSMTRERHGEALGKSKGGVNETDVADATAMRRALRLLVITGQRRGEVIGMRKAELQLEGDAPLWSLPKERTKNRLPHHVPLTPMAVEILREAIEASGTSEFVFPSSKTDGHLIGDAVTKAMQRLCKRLAPKIVGLGVHDIRRTVGTEMRKLGVITEDRGHVFNHVSGAKSKVTSWNYDAGEHDDEKRAALEKWERGLQRIVGLGGANVVKLRA